MILAGCHREGQIIGRGVGQAQVGKVSDRALRFIRFAPWEATRSSRPVPMGGLGCSLMLWMAPGPKAGFPRKSRSFCETFVVVLCFTTGIRLAGCFAGTLIPILISYFFWIRHA